MRRDRDDLIENIFFRSKGKNLNNFPKRLFNKISIILTYELFDLSSLEDRKYGNISESFLVILLRVKH